MSAFQPLANVRSQTFYVARTYARCCHCGWSTRLLALVLPHDHEILDEDTQTDADESSGAPPEVWQRANTHAFLFYVEHLPEEIQRRLNQLAPFFRPAYSPVTLNSYWANYCEHCKASLGDHELHCEPDGAFMPASEAAAAEIHLLQIQAPFEAVAAGYAFEPEFFRFMRKS